MKISLKEIQGLIEGQTIEFKKSLSLRREALEALCGMINADAAKGKIIFGISPNGSVNGIEPGNLDTAQQTLAQHINHKFAPSIICSINVFECDGVNIIILEAKRATEISYHEYDGRAFIREGSTTRQLSYQEKHSLLKKRDRSHHNGPWKCNKYGALVGQLISYEFTGNSMKKTYNSECGAEFWPAD